MAQTTRKRTSNTTIQSRSKRPRKQDGEDDSHDATHSLHRRIDANDEEPVESNGQDGEELSTQSISELETDITTFIRNTGKNDGWPAAFQKHVREREEELLGKLGSGNAEREQAEESFQKTFLPFLAGCLARVGVKPVHPQLPFPIENLFPENQPLFTKSSTLIQGSRNLLKEYSDLASLHVDTSSRDKLLDTLAREGTDVDAAIKAGRRVARAEIRALLGFAENELIENSQQGSNVLKAGALWTQVKARAKGEMVEGGKMEKWGVVAAETVKVFGKMSKVAGADQMVE